MDTSKELNYRLYIQREEGFRRPDIGSEFSIYDAIKNGDIDTIKKNAKKRRMSKMTGTGVLSDSPLRNSIYHLVVSAGIIARVCIDAGMPHNESYTLSDIYIKRADSLSDPEAVVDLLYEMQLDYTERMHKLKNEKHGSVYVMRAIDYVYDHLDASLSMQKLATYVGLNPSYFSKLFAKETHITAKTYINKVKIQTASQMLKDLDLAISDISLSLGYSSQSAFTAVFRKHTGLTPGEYRKDIVSEGFISCKRVPTSRYSGRQK